MTDKDDYIDSIDKFVCRKVYDLRVAQKLSRDYFAKAIGVTDQQLYKYEKGINRISAGRLLLISDLLDCKISDLYEGIGQKTQVVTAEQLPEEVSQNFIKIKNSKI